jgi:hypothetical protein
MWSLFLRGLPNPFRGVAANARGSTYLLWRSIAYIDAYGPKSAHARTQDEIVKPGLEKQVDGEAAVGGTSDSTQPQDSAA